MEGDTTGHDWWHVVRVVNNAKTIATKEGGDPFIIELTALLHDIADWKFHDGNSASGAKISRDWLETLKVDAGVVEQVAYIVEHISFKGGTNTHVMQTLDGQIVQDADRLDALGAVGIARAFATGAVLGNAIYDPEVAPKNYKSPEEFKKELKNNHTINHFYEKLLLIKDKMNTQTGKNLAAHRHKFMERYLQEFYKEWGGKH